MALKGPKGSQFWQVPMFAQAKDLADPEQVRHLDSSGYDGADEKARFYKMRERKISESMKRDRDSEWVGSSLHDSIEEEGVKTPVDMEYGMTLGKTPRMPELSNGHHRVFAAENLDPNMEIPVAWSFPTRDITWKGPLGDVPKWTDFTRNPGQDDAFPPDPRPSKDDE